MEADKKKKNAAPHWKIETVDRKDTTYFVVKRRRKKEIGEGKCKIWVIPLV